MTTQFSGSIIAFMSLTPEGLAGRIADRVEVFFEGRPLQYVRTAEEFARATRVKKTKDFRVWIAFKRDSLGLHASALLRSQDKSRGEYNEANVTILREEFSKPEETEPEDVWRLRVVAAVDQQIQAVEQLAHRTPALIDYEVVEADGHLRREPILPEDRVIIRAELAERHLEPLTPIQPQTAGQEVTY